MRAFGYVGREGRTEGDGESRNEGSRLEMSSTFGDSVLKDRTRCTTILGLGDPFSGFRPSRHVGFRGWWCWPNEPRLSSERTRDAGTACLLVSPASVHPWFGTRGIMISQARSRIIVRDDLESAALSGHWSCSMGAYRPNYRDAHA